MIPIKRQSPPSFLTSDRVQAAKEALRSSYEKTTRQERLKFDFSLLGELKSDLDKLCKGKCVYCESRIESVGPGNVDNFRPKSGARGLTQSYAPLHYWWLAYEWDNLLLACEMCSHKYKRDYFPLENESARAPVGALGTELAKENPLLIDPASDVIESHLEFEETGLIRSISTKGKVTIDILGLNREDLVARRRQSGSNLLNRLETLIDSKDLTNQRSAELVAFVRELFSDQPSQEFVAVQRTVFDAWYENNASLWENVKSIHNDPSKKHQQSKKPLTESYQENMQEVSQQLSAIKRFSIKSITIENFRSIDNLVLDVLPVNDQESRESWLLLLGDNGIGKSSVLQAVAMTLAGKKQLAKLQLDVHDFLKKGTNSGKVIIQSYEHDKPVELHFDANGFRTDLEEALSFVLAYGSTRLLPKGNIQPDRQKEPYLNVRNLFDYSTALNDARQWLRTINQTNPIEFADRVAPALFDLLALRGDDEVWIDGDEVCIRQFGDDQELESNSDGYKNVVAIAADMMQTLSVESANYHNSYGIVLIDELGNHLHPRWRMQIVSALRKAFPKLQFIVTTHEPLCLRGLSHGEVVVLARDPLNKIVKLDRQVLPDHNLLRIDQLLTSDLFGLINVLDDATEKMYADYYKLLSKRESDRTEEEKKQISDFSKRLSEKELLGSSPLMQALFQTINENFAQKIREEGFSTHLKLKEDSVAAAKEYLKTVEW